MTKKKFTNEDVQKNWEAVGHKVDLSTGEQVSHVRKVSEIRKGSNLPPERVMPRIRTGITAIYERYTDYENNSGVSVTVPGQAMTVQEIIRRHRQGLPLEQGKGAVYQGEEVMPNIDDMDLIDRATYIDSVADALVEIKTKLQAEAKTQKEKDFLKRVEEETNKRLLEIKKNMPRNTTNNNQEEINLE